MAQPDLVIGNLILSQSSVAAVGGLSIDFSIVNVGGASAVASTAKLCLSNNPIIDSGDTLLGDFAISSLSPGGSDSADRAL